MAGKVDGSFEGFVGITEGSKGPECETTPKVRSVLGEVNINLSALTNSSLFARRKGRKPSLSIGPCEGGGGGGGKGGPSEVSPKLSFGSIFCDDLTSASLCDSHKTLQKYCDEAMSKEDGEEAFISLARFDDQQIVVDTLKRQYGVGFESLSRDEALHYLKTGHLNIDLTKTSPKVNRLCSNPEEEDKYILDAAMGVASSEGIIELTTTRVDCRPEATVSGKSGSYFIKEGVRGEKVGVFKPKNEEMGELHASDLKVGMFGRRDVGAAVTGVEPGHGYIFERAAYLLANKFFKDVSVPKTVYMQLASNEFSTKGCTEAATAKDITKVGSFQQFIAGKNGEAFRRPEIEKIVPESQFQSMIAFDLAIYGADRNQGNILIDPKGNLYLIDHSAICAKGMDARMNAFWHNSLAAKRPFSDEISKEVLTLDPEDMIRVARGSFAEANEVFPEEHAKSIRISVAILQEGVKLGLTPREIFYCYYKANNDAFLESSYASNLHLDSDKKGMNAREVIYASFAKTVEIKKEAKYSLLIRLQMRYGAHIKEKVAIAIIEKHMVNPVATRIPFFAAVGKEGNTKKASDKWIKDNYDAICAEVTRK